MEQKETQEQTPTTNPQPASAPANRRPVGKIIAGGIIALLLIVIAILAWQLWVCLDNDKKADADKKLLQTQIDGYKKQLEEAQKSSANNDPNPAQCKNSASPSLAQNIAAAIGSQNTGALQGYMATSVNVVIAASEKSGNVTAAQAVTDLDYTKTGTAPWNFSLPSNELAAYKTGFYKQYFPDTAYVGKAQDNLVVSFGFDCNGKINTIFMAANADLLK